MSGPEHHELAGEPVAIDKLKIHKATDLARLLDSGRLPFLSLIEVRRVGLEEIVVLDVEPEVPQRPRNDIRRTERIAVRFDPEDRLAPDPLALRSDFPRVPHLNLRSQSVPRSLCLTEEPYVEQKLSWTASKFVRQLHRWLSLTARGELHEQDQPLEPFILANPCPLIVPSDFFDPEIGKTGVDLDVFGREVSAGRISLIARRAGDPGRRSGLPFVAVVVEGKARPHGVVHRQPTTLAELHELLALAGVDILAELRDRMLDWRERDDRRDVRTLIVVRLPKSRGLGGDVEEIEVWAFLTLEPVSDLGEALGMMAEDLPLVGGHDDAAESAGDIKLQLLNPMPALTAERARLLNGIASDDDPRITAVGTGALGSQVLMNLLRAGWGHWTIVDDDVLLPHNLARHALDGFWLGASKAAAVQAAGRSLYENQERVESLVRNVLTDPGEIADLVREADCVVDLAASVAVSRTLAHDFDGGRRIALFLNPSGSDLVLLAEDVKRHHRLDHLEMGYYRALIKDKDLEGHLTVEPGRIRYANACRDVSSQIPQDVLSTLSGVAARALRRACSAEGPDAVIWRTDETLSVSRYELVPASTDVHSVGGWTLVVDHCLLRELRTLRRDRLPNETGGVLVGARDLTRRILYVIDTIPSPPDSTEWPTLYIRGKQGLEREVRRIEMVTGGGIGYVGEWHTHPDGVSVRPSDDDRTVFSWLAKHLIPDGYPPLMAIAGEHDDAWFVGGI